METSCGVVLVNYGTVLLLQYPQGHWDLPKGHVEAGDSDRKATMRRELAEETGIADVSVLDGFEERTEYTFRHKGKRQSKEVYWYVAAAAEGHTDAMHNLGVRYGTMAHKPQLQVALMEPIDSRPKPINNM